MRDMVKEIGSFFFDSNREQNTYKKEFNFQLVVDSILICQKQRDEYLIPSADPARGIQDLSLVFVGNQGNVRKTGETSKTSFILGTICYI